MAQTAMTVRLDSQLKAQFDQLCEEFGMSANTAFNIFVKAVIRSGSIPFSINVQDKEGKQALIAIEEMRKAAQKRAEPEMTLDEINEEIRAARAERKARLASSH